ncbi:MAG: cytochrome c3 family protein [Polyangia bacterium]
MKRVVGTLLGTWVGTLALGCTAVLSACAPRPQRPSSTQSPAPTGHAAPALVTSNVARADYAGSAACAGCHTDETESLMKSPMHNMTRDIHGAAVRAPFAGETFRYKSDSVQLTKDGGDHFCTLDSKTQGERIYRITRVIGGRYREDYAGVQVDAARTNAVVVGKGDERIMPMSYVFAEKGYRYKGYSVMTPERPGMRPGAVWSRTCIFCHNTVPYLDTALGALTTSRAPYQGEVVDGLLPESRRAHLWVPDHRALKTALDAEMKVLGAQPLVDQPADGLAAQAIRAIRKRFDAGKLVEIGIGCESCHLGSKEHVQHYETKPSFAPRGAIAVETTGEPEVARASAINHACARCHQVLFTGYPFTWEGGRRADSLPGGSHISSGEARDFLLGACQTRLSCARCHDPHAADGDAQRAKLEGLPGNKLCIGCHTQYATAEALRAHSHHDPSGKGAVCMDCHMPKKNMSLDMKLSRYHRIGSPNDPARVEHDRPLECAICHADKSVGELADAMEKWWGKKIDRSALRLLYGDPTSNVLMATLARGKPHEQAVALYALGEGKVVKAAPLVAAQLTHPYPILRYFARDALEKLIGDSPIDLNSDNDLITRAAATWLARARMRPISTTTTAATPSAEDED